VDRTLEKPLEKGDKKKNKRGQVELLSQTLGRGKDKKRNWGDERATIKGGGEKNNIKELFTREGK